MPTTTIELITGPRVSRKNRTAEFDYLVMGAADADEAQAAVEGTADATYGDGAWPLDDIVVEPRGQHWFVRAIYAQAGGGNLPETGTVLVEWDTGGGTEKRNFSEETIATFPSGGPNLNHAINYKDGKVEGVDVVWRRKRLIIKKYVANSDLADAEDAADACTSAVNDDTFYGYAAGEVLLIRARAARRSNSDYEITYEFEVRPNQTGITIAGITGVNKKGHEHAWPLYGEAVDGSELATQVRFVYVERLYPLADFDLLELE